MKKIYRTEFETLDEYLIWKTLNENIKECGTTREGTKITVDYLVIG